MFTPPKLLLINHPFYTKSKAMGIYMIEVTQNGISADLGQKWRTGFVMLV